MPGCQDGNSLKSRMVAQTRSIEEGMTELLESKTTHGYVEADLALKEKALEKVAPAGQKTKRFQADDQLLRFLTSL